MVGRKLGGGKLLAVRVATECRHAPQQFPAFTDVSEKFKNQYCDPMSMLMSFKSATGIAGVRPYIKLNEIF